MTNFIFRFSTFLLLTLVIACSQSNDSQKDIKDVILKDTESYFYIDTKNYPVKDKTLPVGVFDSGTGGLTVLDAIINYDKFENFEATYSSEGDNQPDFRNEKFIYLGDMANMPYGQYSSHDKTELLKEHIIKDVQFLLGSKYYSSANANNYMEDKSPVKAIVIACNTATAYGKDDIENFIDSAGLDIKVIGVIGAGVRGALSNIEKNENASIGVFATFGTVCSNGYYDEIIATSNKSGFTGNIKVFQQAGIGLAGAIDGAPEYIDKSALSTRNNYMGPSTDNKDALLKMDIIDRYNFDWSSNGILFEGTENSPGNVQINSIENYISYHVVSFLEQLTVDENTPPLKSIILGCTHYPFYTEQFRNKLHELYNYRENGEYAYRHVMSKDIEIIDPAENTSKELYEHLYAEDLFNESALSESEFYISVPNKDNQSNIIEGDNGFSYEYKYGRTHGIIQQYVKRVPFSRANLSEETIGMLSSKIPFTYQLIKSFNENNPKTANLTKKEKL